MNNPKRRKSKDNPYTLAYDSDNNKYTISFKDANNNYLCVEVDYSIYEVFNNFELIDLSELNEYDRHIEHFNIMENDEILYKRISDKKSSIDEIVDKKIITNNLKYALNKLSARQKRRIKMYYFEEKTLEEIARIEACSIHSVFMSIERGKKKLKNFLNQV